MALEQAVAAPFCSRQLADLGADVIKVERPDGGDSARAYDGALNGDVGVLRLAQSRQAQRRARSQDAPTIATLCAQLIDARRRRSCTTSRRARWSDWASATTQCRARNPRLDLVRHLRLRSRRPDARQEGVRHARAGGVGRRVGHRQRRRAGQGRHLDRRHRVGDVRLFVDSRRAATRASAPARASASTSRCSSVSPSG